MAELNLDPDRMYAELKAGTNIVVSVFAGIHIPGWANIHRTILLIPLGATVLVGDRYYNGTFDRPSTAQTLVDGAWVSDTAALADKARTDALDTDIKNRTIGTVDLKTIDQLKAMTFTEYSAWFDANFDTAAKVIGLVKRLLLILIRKVL